MVMMRVNKCFFIIRLTSGCALGVSSENRNGSFKKIRKHPVHFPCKAATDIPRNPNGVKTRSDALRESPYVARYVTMMCKEREESSQSVSDFLHLHILPIHPFSAVRSIHIALLLPFEPLSTPRYAPFVMEDNFSQLALAPIEGTSLTRTYSHPLYY